MCGWSCLETPDPSSRRSNLQYSLSRLPPRRDSTKRRSKLKGAKGPPNELALCADGRVESWVSRSPLWWVTTACMRRIVLPLPSLHHHQDTIHVHDALRKGAHSGFDCRISQFHPPQNPKPSNPIPGSPPNLGGKARSLGWSRRAPFGLLKATAPDSRRRTRNKLLRWICQNIVPDYVILSLSLASRHTFDHAIKAMPPRPA
jgi:hypothetical protein